MIPIQWINYNRQISISAHEELLLLHKKSIKDTQQEIQCRKQTEVWRAERKCCKVASLQKVKSYSVEKGQSPELGPALMSQYVQEFLDELWKLRHDEERRRGYFSYKVFNFPSIFPLGLCLTSSYEPRMTCHWVTSHFSCIASSAAFVPTSSAFLPVLPPVLPAQTEISGSVERQWACPYPLPLFVLGHLCAGLGSGTAWLCGDQGAGWHQTAPVAK